MWASNVFLLGGTHRLDNHIPKEHIRMFLTGALNFAGKWLNVNRFVLLI